MIIKTLLTPKPLDSQTPIAALFQAAIPFITYYGGIKEYSLAKLVVADVLRDLSKGYHNIDYSKYKLRGYTEIQAKEARQVLDKKIGLIDVKVCNTNKDAGHRQRGARLTFNFDRLNQLIAEQAAINVAKRALIIPGSIDYWRDEEKLSDANLLALTISAGLDPNQYTPGIVRNVILPRVVFNSQYNPKTRDANTPQNFSIKAEFESWVMKCLRNEGQKRPYSLARNLRRLRILYNKFRKGIDLWAFWLSKWSIWVGKKLQKGISTIRSVFNISDIGSKEESKKERKKIERARKAKEPINLLQHLTDKICHSFCWDWDKKKIKLGALTPKAVRGLAKHLIAWREKEGKTPLVFHYESGVNSYLSRALEAESRKVWQLEEYNDSSLINWKERASQARDHKLNPTVGYEEDGEEADQAVIARLKNLGIYGVKDIELALRDSQNDYWNYFNTRDKETHEAPDFKRVDPLKGLGFIKGWY